MERGRRWGSGTSGRGQRGLFQTTQSTVPAVERLALLWPAARGSPLQESLVQNATRAVTDNLTPSGGRYVCAVRNPIDNSGAPVTVEHPYVRPLVRVCRGGASWSLTSAVVGRR